MHDGELWQVYAENGEPLAGKGATDEMFAHDESFVMGNAHVWLWRRGKTEPEILLQKRSVTRSRAPGMFHISAAGHINLGETPVIAAERETKEELGLTINPAELYLVHTTRVARHRRSLLYVFIYELTGNDELSFDDGEVELVKWVKMSAFKEMIAHAEVHQLIDQGMPYFAPLIEAIEQQV